MRIGFIGAGNMTAAIVEALVHKQVVMPDEITLADVRGERLDALQQRLGVRVTACNREATVAQDAVVLAVKPQQLDAVLRDLQTAPPRGLVLSIAAGKRLAWLEQRLPEARIIRVMPNLACCTGTAMSVFCRGNLATDDDGHTAQTLLSAFGRVLEMPEEYMDGVTAVSGSGPAFFARMARAMAVAAAREGLAPDQALLLAAQTMRGTAALLMEGGLSPDNLVTAVSSAKGVTVAGLAVMDACGFDAIVQETIAAAAQRSRELADATGPAT